MVVVSSCTTETVFDYRWKQVVQAYWNRYPNPSSTHVLTEDTIRREVRDGKLYSRRLLSKTNPVPKWGERFYKNTPIKIIEDSVLDLKTRTLKTFTRNIGFLKIMKVDEYVEYSEQKDGRTLAVRRAYVSSQVFGFSRAIRALGIERFKSNCNKAANGFNYVLEKMFPESKIIISSAISNAPANTTSAITDSYGISANSSKSTNPNSMALSTTDAMKKKAYTGYIFLKTHAGKILQIFSVKN